MSRQALVVLFFGDLHVRDGWCEQYTAPYGLLHVTFFSCVDVMATRASVLQPFEFYLAKQCPRHLRTRFTTLLTPPQQHALPLDPQLLPPQHQRPTHTYGVHAALCAATEQAADAPQRHLPPMRPRQKQRVTDKSGNQAVTPATARTAKAGELRQSL